MAVPPAPVGTEARRLTSARFFGPLIYLDDPEKFTVALALAAMVQRIGTEWNEVMAANLIVMLPVLIVYFFAQDKLIGGIANVGLKG